MAVALNITDCPDLPLLLVNVIHESDVVADQPDDILVVTTEVLPLLSEATTFTGLVPTLRVGAGPGTLSTQRTEPAW